MTIKAKIIQNWRHNKEVAHKDAELRRKLGLPLHDVRFFLGSSWQEWMEL